MNINEDLLKVILSDAVKSSLNDELIKTLRSFIEVFSPYDISSLKDNLIILVPKNNTIYLFVVNKNSVDLNIDKKDIIKAIDIKNFLLKFIDENLILKNN